MKAYNSTLVLLGSNTTNISVVDPQFFVLSPIGPQLSNYVDLNVSTYPPGNYNVSVDIYLNNSGSLSFVTKVYLQSKDGSIYNKTIFLSDGNYVARFFMNDSYDPTRLLAYNMSNFIIAHNIKSVIYTYNSSIPTIPSNYYFFYNDTDTITVKVLVNITPAVSINDVTVMADFSLVNLSDSNLEDQYSIVANSSGSVSGNYYEYTLKYPIVGITANETIPVAIPIYINITNTSGIVMPTSPINYSFAIINFDPKEDIPGLNNPNTTSWRSIDDFSNITYLAFEYGTTKKYGLLELFGNATNPINLLDINFITNLSNLGSNLIISAKLMSIKNATTAMKALNKPAKLTFYGVATPNTDIYAFDDDGNVIAKVYDSLTNTFDSSYLKGNPVYSNGKFIFEVKHWSGYRINQLPVASITAPSSAVVGETVTFNASQSFDPDGTIVSYYWNFGDGITASGAVVQHTYSNAGTYTVTLTVTDNEGSTNSTSMTIVVQVPPTTAPQPSGGGGGRGLFAPGTPRFASSYFSVSAGVEKRFELPYDRFLDTYIDALNIVADGDTELKFTIEKLDKLPGELSAPKKGRILLIWSIDVDTSRNVDVRGKIEFAIPRSLIAESGFDPDNAVVTLLRYSDGWQALPTTLIEKSSEFNYYSAETPGFSYFAAVVEEALPPNTTTVATTTTAVATTTTEAVTTTTEAQQGGGIPGFEVLLAIVGLIASAYLLRR